VEGDAHAAAGDGMAMFMKVLVAIGVPEDGLGWTRFFYLCAICAIPGMLMLRWVAPYKAQT